VKRVRLDQVRVRLPQPPNAVRQTLADELERRLGDARLAQQAADAIVARLPSGTRAAPGRRPA
jgi:hypothetical protein